MKKYNKTVNDYLRNTFNAYIRNVLIENECCICGSKDNLHLHHDNISHNELCKECLEDLGYENNNCLDFTGRQLQNLENIYIGKSFTDVKYKTLCDECHRKLHSENGYRQKTYGNDGKTLNEIFDDLKNDNLHYENNDLINRNLNLTQENKNLIKANDKLRKKIRELENNKF